MVVYIARAHWSLLEVPGGWVEKIGMVSRGLVEERPSECSIKGVRFLEKKFQSGNDISGDSHWVCERRNNLIAFSKSTSLKHRVKASFNLEPFMGQNRLQRKPRTFAGEKYLNQKDSTVREKRSPISCFMAGNINWIL